VWTQLERHTEHDQQEVELISRQLRCELARFDHLRCRDFQSSIVVYLESLMNTQQQVTTAAARWRQLANTTESSACSGDAALCHIIFTTFISLITVLGKLFTPIVPLFIKQRNW